MRTATYWDRKQAYGVLSPLPSSPQLIAFNLLSWANFSCNSSLARGSPYDRKSLFSFNEVGTGGRQNPYLYADNWWILRLTCSLITCLWMEIFSAKSLYLMIYQCGWTSIFWRLNYSRIRQKLDKGRKMEVLESQIWEFILICSYFWSFKGISGRFSSRFGPLLVVLGEIWLPK